MSLFGIGGAIATGLASSIKSHNLNISDNEAKVNGGFLFSGSGSNIEVVSSMVMFNEALDGSGGGIYIASNSELMSLSKKVNSRCKYECCDCSINPYNSSLYSLLKALNGYFGQKKLSTETRSI